MLKILVLLWKYRKVLSMVYSAFKGIKEVYDGVNGPQQEKQASYRIVDFIRESRETDHLIDQIENRDERKKWKKEYRNVRKEARIVRSLEGFDELQKKLRALRTGIKKPNA